MKQEEQPELSVPPLEFRNVRLRFFLGPDNLNILKCAEEVMEKYPIIVCQFDYRFDIYGRPKDIADVFKEGLFETNKLNVFGPQQEERVPQSLDSDSESTPASRPRDPQGDEDEMLQTGSSSLGEEEKTFASFGVVFNNFASKKSSIPHLNDASQALSVLPFSPASTFDTSRRNQNRILDEPEKLKSDFDLAKERQELLASSDHDTKSTAPWSIVIVLSMNERIAHYLLHRSGGFMSYLAEQQDLESCFRQGMMSEDLKALAESAGLTVGVSKNRMPCSDEIPVWLQVWDMNALRDVIAGITTALATDSLYRKEASWVGNDELVRRAAWDLKLRQYSRSRKYNWLSSKVEGKVEGNVASVDDDRSENTGTDYDTDNDRAKIRDKDKGRHKSRDAYWGFSSTGNDRRNHRSSNTPHTTPGTGYMENWSNWDQPLEPNSISVGQEGYSNEWDRDFQPRHTSERKIPQSAGSRASADFTSTTSQSIASFFSDDEESPNLNTPSQARQHSRSSTSSSQHSTDRGYRYHTSSHNFNNSPRESQVFDENNQYNNARAGTARTTRAHSDRITEQSLRPSSSSTSSRAQIPKGWRASVDEAEDKLHYGNKDDNKAYAAQERLLALHASSSQYYRVKRNTQTIFINSSSPNTDTVATLKQRIVKALSSTKNAAGEAPPTSPGQIQLHIPNKKDPNQYLELIDSKTLAASGLVDQQVIAMTFKAPSGAWEDVFIAQPEALTDLDDLEDEPEEVEITRSSKGKERANSSIPTDADTDTIMTDVTNAVQSSMAAMEQHPQQQQPAESRMAVAELLVSLAQNSRGNEGSSLQDEGVAAFVSAATGNPPATQQSPIYRNAVDYVGSVKKAYESNPKVYTQFLSALEQYHGLTLPIDQLVRTVMTLFQDQPDLLLGFKEFLPESQGLLNQLVPPMMYSDYKAKTSAATTTSASTNSTIIPATLTATS
ncbi:Transcriptional regulatory protein sin3, partial [Mortierella sp. AD094]